MRKLSAIKLIGLAVFCLMGIVVGLSLVHGASSKPTTWKAFLSGNLSEYQGDDVLIGGRDGIAITDGTARCGSGSNATSYSYLQLIIQSPTQVQFTLENPILTYQNGDGTPCGFPGFAPA
jgi:hypothetical protein